MRADIECCKDCQKSFHGLVFYNDIKNEADLFASLIALVELPGFEPGQTEPKSVVLPLHHSSVPIGVQRYNIFMYLQYFSS